jgi:RNA polymerase sigma-70 factor (ECF subfamily)
MEDCEMNETDFLAERFEASRNRLHSVAYRMLGSQSEAEDAVQEAWLRLARSDADAIDNLNAWLTTVIARVCLDMLRSRKSRREDSMDPYIADPIVSRDETSDPEHEAVLADSVGLAMLVVLDMLAPAERLAFVLHDMFAIPFDDIASIIDRSPVATRQLASRARRRVQGARAEPDTDLSRQREVVNAFFAAARLGDFDALVAVLDPDIVVHSDGGPKRLGATAILRGAESVASQAIQFARLAPFVRPAVVNGVAGVVVAPNGQPYSVMAFTVREGRIVEIDALVDPERLKRLDLSFLDE